MSSLIEQTYPAPAGKYLVDSYEDWARAEGIPIHSGVALNLLTLGTEKWARFGLQGAFCHLEGHCDFLTIFLMELTPGASSLPQRHLYEEVCYVLKGHGDTEIELSDGGRRTIEWGPGSLFAPPMNARYRHRCSSSSEPARLVAVNDLRYLMNLYRNEQFLFDAPLNFPEREPGEIVRDVSRLSMGASPQPHELSASLALADGSIGVDIVELPVGVYAKARRQMFGSLILGIAGEGMTSSWAEGEPQRARANWSPGIVFSPTGLLFHQHFNIGREPARFLRVELGSIAYPMFRPRKRAYGDTSVYASGRAEIDYLNEPFEVRQDWLETLAKAGVTSRM